MIKEDDMDSREGIAEDLFRMEKSIQAGLTSVDEEIIIRVDAIEACALQGVRSHVNLTKNIQELCFEIRYIFKHKKGFAL
jgi:hypothetical protein